MTTLTVTKISTRQKFATVGKGRLVAVAVSVHAIAVKCMASASNLISVCDHPFFDPYSRQNYNYYGGQALCVKLMGFSNRFKVNFLPDSMDWLLIIHLSTKISRIGDFCVGNNNSNRTDYFTPLVGQTPEKRQSKAEYNTKLITSMLATQVNRNHGIVW